MILGLTGGIATGKSTAVATFQQYGFPIVDGDVIAREIVEPNQAGLQAIVATFGSEILHADGTLNRQQLGALIFEDATKRQTLDRLLDPILRQTIQKQIDAASALSPLVIADIPLLYEAAYETMVDEVAVVYIPQDIQLQRLMARNQFSEEEAQQRLASQWSIEEKRQRANIVFDNQGTKAELAQQIMHWLEERQFISAN
jgi:dephospho-CoA kinase